MLAYDDAPAPPLMDDELAKAKQLDAAVEAQGLLYGPIRVTAVDAAEDAAVTPAVVASVARAGRGERKMSTESAVRAATTPAADAAVHRYVKEVVDVAVLKAGAGANGKAGSGAGAKKVCKLRHGAGAQRHGAGEVGLRRYGR